MVCNEYFWSTYSNTFKVEGASTTVLVLHTRGITLLLGNEITKIVLLAALCQKYVDFERVLLVDGS